MNTKPRGCARYLYHQSACFHHFSVPQISVITAQLNAIPSHFLLRFCTVLRFCSSNYSPLRNPRSCHTGAHAPVKTGRIPLSHCIASPFMSVLFLVCVLSHYTSYPNALLALVLHRQFLSHSPLLCIPYRTFARPFRLSCTSCA